VIDYRQHDFTNERARYELILDAKTTRSPFRHARALSSGGRYVTVGGDVGRLLQTLLFGSLVLAFSKKRMRIVALEPNKGLSFVSQWFEQGALECVIDGTYALSDLARAVRRFGDAEHVGKIVVRVPG
jgi:NADPH:quinone reductase-like Zn-dependent oxidoreductase